MTLDPKSKATASKVEAVPSARLPSDFPDQARRGTLKPPQQQNIASGVGLGLSIAQDAARAHGGSLDLADSPRLGGLKATVRLPR